MIFLTLSTILTLGAALIVRRKEALVFRWRPTTSTAVAFGAGLLAFGFSLSLLLFPANNMVKYAIHYGLIYLLCGFFLPWGYTLFVEKAPVKDMGLKKDKWKISLALSIILSLLFSLMIIFRVDWSKINWINFGRASLVLTGAGGLFELFLYFGFIHLRLEKAFGVIPAILGSALIYVLWHAGTQLPLEPDLGAAIFKLFLVGVMYQSIFSLTRNLLVIWPFFHWSGVMIDFAVNLEQIDLVSRSFPLAIITLIVIAAGGLVFALLRREQKKRIAGS